MDISAGWDGTHWAVDSQGIPHVYDALQGQWQIFGRGVDAAIQTNNQFFLFRGDEVAINTPSTGSLSTNTIAQRGRNSRPCSPTILTAPCISTAHFSSSAAVVTSA
ncbi:MAG: hypothetical protein R2854_07280 [Caldilineaceae bacterium]